MATELGGRALKINEAKPKTDGPRGGGGGGETVWRRRWWRQRNGGGGGSATIIRVTRASRANPAGKTSRSDPSNTVNSDVRRS